MKPIYMIAICAALAACETPSGIDATKIKPAPQWTLTAPPRLKKPQENDDTVKAYADLRKVYAYQRRKLIFLQGYARTIGKSQRD